MAQIAYQAKLALCRHYVAGNRSHRTEMPLFQAFLRPFSGKATYGHCIKDVTTIEIILQSLIQGYEKLKGVPLQGKFYFGTAQLFLYGGRL